MIIRQIIHTSNPDAWKHFVHTSGAAPIVEDEAWSLYGLGRGRLGIRLANEGHSGIVSLKMETIRLDKVSSPYTQPYQPGQGAELTVIGTDLPEILIVNMEGKPQRGGDLIAAPLLLTARVKDNVPVLESLGLEQRVMSESGGYADFTADGVVGLHERDNINLDSGPRIDLSFEHHDLDAFAEVLRLAGYEPAIKDEAYGRSLQVAVGDEQAWVNESPDMSRAESEH